jgi:hypothetical protein
MSPVAELNNPGGSPGGLGSFVAGCALALVSAYFFVDSVRVTSFGGGWISRMAGGSTGIVFLPLLVGVVWLFYDARKIGAWIVFGAGIGILFVEILSRLDFFFNLKLSHLLIMLISFGAGIGLILRSLRSLSGPDDKPPWRDAFDRIDKTR